MSPCEEADESVWRDPFGGENQEIVCEEEGDDVFDEARRPSVLRDPGAPTQAELAEHNVTHLPYRSWCPSCVAGKARDRSHRKRDQSNKEIPEVVFDYCFMGAEGEEESVAIQVALDRRSRMYFAHVVPRKGKTHEHGAEVMVEDLDKLGYTEIILKCDGELALRSVQEEVKRRREKPTVLENSPVEDSKANGAAERAVQAVEEQVRVLRHALELRLEVKLSGKHPVIYWLVEHAADILSKFLVGEDGKTGYERVKGKKYSGDVVEFGEKVHYRQRKKARSDKMEARWEEGFYFGRLWRTNEAIVGTEHGIVKASAIKRVGAHRRWDAEGLGRVRGVPWKWRPEADDAPKELRVRWLDEDEKIDGKAASQDSEIRVYRMRLRREDFVKHGFTEGCPGCMAIISGKIARGHTEGCRDRMMKAIGNEADGKQRLDRQVEKEKDYFAKELERSCGKEDEERRKRAKIEDRGKRCREEGESSGSGQKRDHVGKEATDESDEKRLRRVGIDLGEKRRRESPAQPEERQGEGFQQQGENPDLMDQDADVSMIEKLMQEDMKWHLDHVSDMCEPSHDEIGRGAVDFAYYDENTWEELDPTGVAAGERDELERFRKMGVYDYVTRREAERDAEGKFVKVKWVRVNKGTADEPKIRCRLVAQELGYGERIDELFAGTPSLTSVRLALHHTAKGGNDHQIMIMDVKSAFLYGVMKRKVYIELPTQDPRYGDGNLVGVLNKAMYGTRDAPQIWQDEVRKTMEEMGMVASAFQPSVYYHRAKGLIVVVHVDDFLCSGPSKSLGWLFDGLKRKYEMSKTVVGHGSETEARYLNRTISYDGHGYTIEGDPKHFQTLKKEWDMVHCSGVDTPMTKDGREKMGSGDQLEEKEALRVRRAIARINYMAQDRADLAVVARVMSQHMSDPHEGTRSGVRRSFGSCRGILA